MKYLLWLLLRLRLYNLLFPTRNRLARKFLSGCGVEIGALHLPLMIPEGATVKYVDRAPADQLREIYPELNIFRFAAVDIIDNGEELKSVAPASQDFIIANHFLEHCENPIKTLLTHISRLKPGGILYLAVPDRDKTFDRRRPITPIAHVIRDFQDGPEGSRFEHYLEWARFVEDMPEEHAERRAKELMEKHYSIHYHVWTQADFNDLLDYVRNMKSGFAVRDAAKCRNEFIFILQKE